MSTIADFMLMYRTVEVHDVFKYAAFDGCVLIIHLFILQQRFLVDLRHIVTRMEQLISW